MTEPVGDPEDLERHALEAFRRREWDQAIQGFRSARDTFLQHGDNLRAAQAANSLSVALLQAGQAQAALRAVEGTPEIFHAAGDRLHEAEATGNWAAALEAVGRVDQAEARYRQAIDLLSGGSSEAEAHTRRALSGLLLRQGRAVEASAVMKRALEIDPRGGWRARWVRKILGSLSRNR
ncbi:MAG TPA: tetratricopeptide repeat protein [Anaerolineales bacterium]|nr:tetratricopeptide repeat protein [Anaerolineales bacterium]